MSQLELGTTLDGLYRLDRLIGVGGVGAVYAAWHLNLGRPVAVKVLHPQYIEHREPVQRFVREAQLLSKLGHPSFVTVYDFSYTQEGTPYLVMELIEGETLHARLSRGPLSVDEALALFRPLCEALAQAHQQRILHRDLKPQNLMLVPGAAMKILDFGMAKLMSDEVPLTADKVVMGTPYYMAPERVKGTRSSDPKTDIFSLGAILYETLSGKMAFTGDTPLAAMYQVVRAKVPPLGLADKQVSARIDQVIARACAKNPQARYASTLELWAGLQAAVDPDRAAPPSRPLAAASAEKSVGKAAVFHGAMHFVRTHFGEEGFQRVTEIIGAERMDRIMGSMPGDLISTNDLYDSNMAISQLFDDGTYEVFREMGRFHAEMMLESIYKALLIPGDPETVLRRSQVILNTTGSGQSRVERVDEQRWRIEFRGIEGLTPHWIACMAGWMQCYLKKTGATATVNEDLFEQGGQLVGRLTISLDAAAP